MASNNDFQRQSRWVELFNPETYYPVLEMLSSYLTIADFLVLCQVCKRLDGLKDCILRRISSVNVRLRDFVNDPIMFRSQLGNCGALISGSFALNFFELSRSKVLYLDVFVKDGPNADQFTNYMRQNERYQNDNPDAETVKSYLLRGPSPTVPLTLSRFQDMTSTVAVHGQAQSFALLEQAGRLLKIFLLPRKQQPASTSSRGTGHIRSFPYKLSSIISFTH
jgi:hypothetical protein